MICRNITQCAAIANVLNIFDISSCDLQRIAINCNVDCYFVATRASAREEGHIDG